MNAAVAYHVSRSTLVDVEQPRHRPVRSSRRALPGLGITVLGVIAAVFGGLA